MVYQNAVAQPREELTDIIIEGVTDDSQFVGLRCFPEMPTKLPQIHAPKLFIGTGDLMRATSKTRKPGTTFDRYQSAIGDYNQTLVQVGEEVQIPDEQALIYDNYFAFEAVYSMESRNRLLRGLEIDIATTMFTTGTGFFDATNGGVAYSAANIATITPVLDLHTAIRLVKARGQKPNTIVIPGTIYDRIRQSADMKSFVAGSVNPGAIVTADTIQKAFASQGITSVEIAEAYVNQSLANSNAVINPIFPLTEIAVLECKSGQLQAGGCARTFYWEREGPLFNMMSYRDEGRKSNILRGMKTTIPGIINARAGTLINTQVTV